MDNQHISARRVVGMRNKSQRMDEATVRFRKLEREYADPKKHVGLLQWRRNPQTDEWEWRRTKNDPWTNEMPPEEA